MVKITSAACKQILSALENKKSLHTATNISALSSNWDVVNSTSVKSDESHNHKI